MGCYSGYPLNFGRKPMKPVISIIVKAYILLLCGKVMIRTSLRRNCIPHLTELAQLKSFDHSMQGMQVVRLVNLIH